MEKKEEKKRHDTSLYAPPGCSTYSSLDFLTVPQLKAHLDQGTVCSYMSYASRQSQYILCTVSHRVIGTRKGYFGRNYFFPESTFGYYFCSHMIWPNFHKLGLFFFLTSVTFFLFLFLNLR